MGNEYDGTGDYLLVVNELNEIVSRWFIIESVRDRAGQYTLTLHRDLVADHYNEILNVPMFIEKATINQINDPAIFNREGLTFNKIKKSEIFLKDESNCPWIVGYIPESFTIANKQIEGDYAVAGNKADFEVNSLPQFEAYNFYTGTEKLKGYPETFYYGYGAKITQKFYLNSDEESFVPQNAFWFFEDGEYVARPEILTPGAFTDECRQTFNSWLPNNWWGTNKIDPGFTYFHKVIGGSY